MQNSILFAVKSVCLEKNMVWCISASAKTDPPLLQEIMNADKKSDFEALSLHTETIF